MGNKIHDLPKEDRPREKLMYGKAEQMTDAELIAILLGSGMPGQNAVEVAQSILDKTGGNLNKLAQLDFFGIKDGINGVGDVKALTIKAALILGTRVKSDQVKDEDKPLTSPQVVYDLLAQYLGNKSLEEFWVIYLNRANKLIMQPLKMSEGTTNATLVDKKEIFRHAVINRADGIIVSHNHPSGQLKPSQADIKLTSQIQNIAEFFGIRFLDHLIYTDNGFFSFNEHGLL